MRGSWDGRLDTHRDVDRGRWLDLSQRRLRQPGGAVSELNLDAKLGRIDLRIGSQEIRWGRADGFNPTDNVVPYDYLDLFSDARIAVPAAKADFYAGKARFEAVWVASSLPRDCRCSGSAGSRGDLADEILHLRESAADVKASRR